MIDVAEYEGIGLHYVKTITFDEKHRSFVFETDNVCVIIDDDICKDPEPPFDYTRYCITQNELMFSYDKLFRFNCTGKSIAKNVMDWIERDAGDVLIEDNGGHFHESHPDNTPIEMEFEVLFSRAYGEGAEQFLRKEYSVSIGSEKTKFADYVVETKSGNYAIETNGINYHHPSIRGDKEYAKQLEKQNTLVLYGFKLYRFSSECIASSDQMIDNIRTYLGHKDQFISSLKVRENRKFQLYEHQTDILGKLEQSRKEGTKAFLVVIPTAAGKSQIAIEDLKKLSANGEINTALIMVPSKAIRTDWEERIQSLPGSLNVEVKLYNRVYMDRNVLESNHYDYIVFDEAHHAKAANCSKSLAYFNPRFLLGLTATPDRMDMQKLEDIFGTYETEMTLPEAIEKDIVSNIRCYRLISNIDLSDVRYNGKDYNASDLERRLIVDSRNELIVDTVKRYFAPDDGFYKQGIVFCVNVEHAKKLEGMFTEQGLSARAVYGSNRENNEIFGMYKRKEVQFLLTCQLISEGWDSPQTEIVVMARPTLSKVLYLQQIGRGVRKYEGKECLYVIDVVDNYASKLTPWSFCSLFKISHYRDFVGVKNNDCDYLSVFGLSEKEIRMEEVDVFTFEEKYKGFLSAEEAARKLYVGTNTLIAWDRKDRYASLRLPIGKKDVPYFTEEDIEKIRIVRKLEVHNDDTLVNDFVKFIDDNDLTFSFKLVFMIGMLELCNDIGQVNIDALLDYFINFYKNRLDRGLPVDRKNCIYDEIYLSDRNKMKKSMLDNPFEKFERKRFVFHYEHKSFIGPHGNERDLNIISFNPILWEALKNGLKDEIIEKEKAFLREYYNDKGGL